MAVAFRCNLCYVKDPDQSSTFSSCGHFICPNCVAPHVLINQDQCPYCHTTCSFLPLSQAKGNVPDGVLQLFRNPADALKSVVESIRFQMAHEDSYKKYLEGETVRSSETAKEMADTRSYAERLEQELKTLKGHLADANNKIRSLERQVSQGSQSLPYKPPPPSAGRQRQQMPSFLVKAMTPKRMLVNSRAYSAPNPNPAFTPRSSVSMRSQIISSLNRLPANVLNKSGDIVVRQTPGNFRAPRSIKSPFASRGESPGSKLELLHGSMASYGRENSAVNQ